MLTVVQTWLTSYCAFMLYFDKGIEDHYYNCGVLIHGTLLAIVGAIALAFLGLKLYCDKYEERRRKDQ